MPLLITSQSLLISALSNGQSGKNRIPSFLWASSRYSTIGRDSVRYLLPICKVGTFECGFILL